jgi:hypothetical protein
MSSSTSLAARHDHATVGDRNHGIHRACLNVQLLIVPQDVQERWFESFFRSFAHGLYHRRAWRPLG